MFSKHDILDHFIVRYPNVLRDNNISDDWKDLLHEVFVENETVLQDLNKFLETIPEDSLLPIRSNIWSFTRYCKPEEVKVVIVGQDPYATRGWAHGLAFSVEKHIKKIPPSLRNILKEVKIDIGNSKYAKSLKSFPSNYGYLEHWAKQGVLLLNSVLTVTVDNSKSHSNKGWETVISKLIVKLQIVINTQEKFLIFMLWGNDAKKMEEFVNKKQGNKVLLAGHPSPLNRLQSFLGCRHFSKTNDILTSVGMNPIDWSLT
ncbi:uracil-DNA glycosylase-like [Diorhabda sublineata]|uniref:uracil-DNA glycosylase-like n=1 Tax=Diorhabda sublineata TaxID=1163346 RepID=UPI0024E11B83|nr:uracil-DNA glycosylase-like [Diorhabda sublineata]